MESVTRIFCASAPLSPYDLHHAIRWMSEGGRIKRTAGPLGVAVHPNDFPLAVAAFDVEHVSGVTVFQNVAANAVLYVEPECPEGTVQVRQFGDGRILAEITQWSRHATEYPGLLGAAMPADFPVLRAEQI